MMILFHQCPDRWHIEESADGEGKAEEEEEGDGSACDEGAQGVADCHSEDEG